MDLCKIFLLIYPKNTCVSRPPLGLARPRCTATSHPHSIPSLCPTHNGCRAQLGERGVLKGHPGEGSCTIYRMAYWHWMFSCWRGTSYPIFVITIISTVSGSFCFRWVQWGERQSGSNYTCDLVCLFCSFCRVSLFVPYFSFTAGLMPISSSSSSCCFVRAAVVCYLFLFGTYVLLAAFQIFLHHIFQNVSGLFCPIGSYFSNFSGLACCVAFSYQVR